MFERLWKAAEEHEIQIAEKDRAEILAAADGLADPYVEKLVEAFANALPSGGIKNFEWGAIKGALLQSIPADEQATNAQLAAAFDKIAVALGGTPPAA